MNVIVLSVGYIGQHQQQDVGRGKIKLLLPLSSQKNTLLRKFLRFFFLIKILINVILKNTALNKQ